MGLYAITGQATTVAGDCMLLIAGNGVCLFEIVEIRIGFTATPDDERYEFAAYETTNEGSGGTAVDVVPLGPYPAASCNAIQGSFSGDPTKLDTKRRATITPHRRSTEVWKNSPGIKPSGMADGRGISIWCITAPSSVTCSVYVIVEE